jgi:outer membrane lipoprotein-sorting protein
MDKDWMYNIDMEKKEGTKLANNYYQNLLAKSKEEDVTDIEEAMMKDMGGSKIGTEEICGKMCDIWDIPKMKTKTWVWEGVSLKIDVQMPGMESVTTATSVKENVDVPEEKFQVPADVTVERDFGDILKGLKLRKQPGTGAAEQSETGAPNKPETEPAKKP